MKDLLLGSACFFKGLALIGKPGLRRFIIAPLILSCLMYTGLFWFLISQFNDVVDWLLSFVPDWLDWIGALLWAVFVALAFGLVFFTFALVASLVGAPFHGALAEATEAHISGSRPPSTSFMQTLSRFPGTLLNELAKLSYSLLLAAPCLLLFLIPVLNIAAPALWFACCAWVTTFTYTDHAMSNHGLRLAEVRRHLRGRRMLALGFGATAFLALMVPVVNAFTVPAAVAGGTCLWIEQLRTKQPAQTTPTS